MTASGCRRAPRRRTPAGSRGVLAACLATLLLSALVLAPGAGAAPAVTFKVKPLPIPGFPGTGNILGAGAEVVVQDTISGTEYGGVSSPLVLLSIDAPAGTEVTSAGFATCAPSALADSGPS